MQGRGRNIVHIKCARQRRYGRLQIALIDKVVADICGGIVLLAQVHLFIDENNAVTRGEYQGICWREHETEQGKEQVIVHKLHAFAAINKAIAIDNAYEKVDEFSKKEDWYICQRYL